MAKAVVRRLPGACCCVTLYASPRMTPFSVAASSQKCRASVLRPPRGSAWDIWQDVRSTEKQGRGGELWGVPS